jgi:tetratricopeptide (TPR) repeat protein
MTRLWSRGIALSVLLAAAACASNPKPLPAGPVTQKFPEYPLLVIPASLTVTQDIRDRHEQAWRRLQTGDLRNANREFNDTLRRSATFYPAETGLGFVALAGRDFKQAAQRFGAALSKNDRYLPAWLGLADAEVGLGRDPEAIAALERALELDPKRDALRGRLELLRFKEVQTLVASGQRARQAGRLDEAERTLERALTLSPSSAVILRELSATETARGAHDAAEEHARRAVELDPNDAESHAALGAALEAQERYREAAAEFGRAAAIDPRPLWRERSTALREKANLSAIPPEFRDLASAVTVSRAQVAALIGTRLEVLVDRAPRRGGAVATDVRSHWAAPWILPVTQAGIMEIQPNHTFQPGETVRRADLARVVSQLLAVVAAERQIDLARWRAARPRFTDLPGTNLFYNAAALAVASGAMDTPEGNRFLPTRPVTGAELLAAIDRIEQLAGR